MSETRKKNISQKKRKYKKIELTEEEEETLIDLIKNNEELYNVRHEKYKNKHHKDRLWLEIAENMNKPGEYI